MENDLINLGKSLKKDAKESEVNTGRVQSNFPQVERKLDIVSGGYNFTMDLPLSDVSSIVSLDMRIRPDNCCECEAGGITGLRKGTGDVTRWEDINGNPLVLNQPADSPQNAVEFKGVVTSMTTVGVLDSIWFAWPGYPFFYPDEEYEDDFETNKYGDFNLTDGNIRVPTAGVYNITFSGHASGYTTATSKITLTLKKKVYTTGIWEEISREVRSVMKGNLQPNSMMIALDLTISAICYGFEANDAFAVWVVSEDIDNINYSTATIQFILMGEGLGQISGYVFHDPPSENPIMGATVQLQLPWIKAVQTNSLGYYVITDITPGIHTVTATYETFTSSQKVTVERNRMISNVNFIL